MESKERWEPMKLTNVGDVGEVVQTSTGGGKLTLMVGDTGEELTKPPSQEEPGT